MEDALFVLGYLNIVLLSKNNLVVLTLYLTLLEEPTDTEERILCTDLGSLGYLSERKSLSGSSKSLINITGLETCIFLIQIQYFFFGSCSLLGCRSLLCSCGSSLLSCFWCGFLFYHIR